MEITKLGLLLSLRDYYHFQLGQHATDFMMTASRPGHEHHYSECKQKVAIMDELITEQEEAKA